MDDFCLQSACQAASSAPPPAPGRPALSGDRIFAGLLQMRDLVSALLMFFFPSLYYNQDVMFFI